MRAWPKTALIAISLFLSHMAMAEVVLQSDDGSFSIRGELLQFQDGQYTIRSVLGTIVIDSRVVVCEGEECPELDPPNQIVRVAGPGVLITELMPDLVETFASDIDADTRPAAEQEDAGSEDNDVPGDIEIMQLPKRLATFTFDSMQPAQAFAAMLAGEADIVLSDRRIADAELDEYLAAGLGDITNANLETVIALDGYAPLVSASNPVRQIQFEQFLKILSGEISNWSALGGADEPIKVYLPEAKTAMAEEFSRVFMAPRSLRFASASKRLASLTELSKAVAADEQAIGLGSASLAGNAQTLSLMDECMLPVHQDRFALKAEDSLLSRRIYLYTVDRPDGPTRALGFLKSAAAASSKNGLDTGRFIDLQPEIATMDRHGHQLAYTLAEPALLSEQDQLREFAKNTLGAERLSLTFRFDPGSSKLDSKAMSDVERLTRLLSSEGFMNRQVMLTGFTDSEGGSGVNRVLSFRRAEQVLEVLGDNAKDELDLTRIKPLGFGAAYPVACNSSEDGRRLNRRVEVWIR